MILNVEKIPDKCGTLIPVMSENVSHKGEVTSIEIIKCGGNLYTVHDAFRFSRDEIFPVGLMIIATGKVITPEKIWEKYPNSDSMFIFICTEAAEKEEKKGEQKTEIPDL